VAGSPASMATKLAGWVTDEVMVTPSSSKAAIPLASSRPASAMRSCMAYRPARWLRITASPVWWLPTSSRYRSQRPMPSGAGVGPHSAAEASQPRTSVSCRSSPARRAWTAAWRQASSAAAESACSQCTAARSRQAWQRPTSSRLSTGQPARESGGSTLAQQRRWYYESTRVHPAAPSSQPADRGTPVALLTALAAAAVLALSLDALSVRRKTRRSAAHPAT